jgi:hypothetical protein
LSGNRVNCVNQDLTPLFVGQPMGHSWTSVSLES